MMRQREGGGKMERWLFWWNSKEDRRDLDGAGRIERNGDGRDIGVDGFVKCFAG